MPSRSSKRFLITFALLCVAMLHLTGCDKPLTGKYEEVDGAGALEFRDNRVFITLAIVGTTFAADYEMQGNQIIISGAGPAQVYALNADGSIEAGAGLRFVKQP